ncbi:MAG: lipid-transfer protein [Myxococcales bacterium SG8_38_1]|jgi:acetyl-CoA acetyltransferase|nr:MAG: lipid-transfer protein [Myxococcales bacterium SG8_38_1]
MRDVAIVSFAQLPSVKTIVAADEPELVQPVTSEAMKQIGLTQDDIGFTCSGSTDYLPGRPFSFVAAVDGLKAVPPIRESHVEMDGAFALFEAWVRLLHGDIDTALVFSFGKCSLGPVPAVLNLQNDPYYVQPLGLDAISAAALQAQAMIDASMASERDFAEIAARNRRNAIDNPNAHIKGDFSIDAMLDEPYLSSPIRKSFCSPLSDSAAAIVLAAGDAARKLVKRPAWIRGIDHRTEPHALGQRDLTTSPSAKLAAEKAGVGKGKVDIAELHAPFAHQEIILRQAMGLDDDVKVNPSGGALAANSLMTAGLIRFGEAANRILSGDADRAVAHTTSGACLQQNLVAVLEGE